MKCTKQTIYWLITLGVIVIFSIGLTIYWDHPIAYSNYFGGITSDRGGVYTTDSLDVKSMGSVSTSLPIGYLETDSYIDTSGDTQLIIKSGDVSLTVSNIESFAYNVALVAEQYNGTVTNRSISNYPNSVKSGWISIEFDAMYFDTVMADIKELSNIVESENIYTYDVTKTVVDLQARLSNAQAEEAQYLLIMSRATTVEDMISIQNALSGVRERIEVMESEMNYYNSSIAKSTISMYVTEETAIGFEKNTFRPLQTMVEAVQKVIELFQSLVISLIYVLIVGGAILIPSAAIFVIGRAIWKKYRT